MCSAGGSKARAQAIWPRGLMLPRGNPCCRQRCPEQLAAGGGRWAPVEQWQRASGLPLMRKDALLLRAVMKQRPTPFVWSLLALSGAD